ncbi:glycerate kinase type-2 family protein [Pseudodesulfovibrio sediminis]|uniref:Hydroxypyruvate reductase n=1 Tax=Pseudodesulfovibrio sediminis TaxID=2810563 RepID=A0ABM7P4K9_9BACT|nr:glycerate kinase [Pseudodesulfovibrio sediminis]BCS87783.1 hydroxypyruvate reductase [Pseudodesulfovibrio sediminis]
MTQYSAKKQDLLRIIDSAIHAVSPEIAMQNTLKRTGDILTVEGTEYDLTSYERIIVVGAGKASASMAKKLEELLGDLLHGGIVATKYGHGLELKKTWVMEAGHPVPDMAGQRASKDILGIAKGLTENDLVFCLLSGGASAIVPAPREPVTLQDKQATTRALLECGATINEINAIRKNLSLFKGGHLAKALEPATVITLIISDVIGDYLDVIGSGPTAPDESTFLDCQAILDKYALCSGIPEAVTTIIAAGCAGEAPETCKAGDKCFERVQNVIIAGNAMALTGAAKTAQELGYTPILVDAAIQGEARDVAKKLVEKAIATCGEHSEDTRICLLYGGETTVTIKGNGKGGRNQELALAAGIKLLGAECRERIALACVGTDGTDGPTDAAGGLIFPDTVTERGERAAREHLANNDAYHFLSNVGTILKTGPTRTNVMDIAIVLVGPNEPKMTASSLQHHAHDAIR